MNVLTVSDIHFGNSKVTPEQIYMNIHTDLIPHLTEHKVDVLIIEGDFFHKLSDLNSHCAFWAARTINDILHVCSVYGVILRVVRGTFLHDRDQCLMFQALNQGLTDAASHVDLEVIDNYKLEYIKHLDLRLAYMPDVTLPKEDTISTFKESIKLNVWDSVDLVAGHGMFDFALPIRLEHKADAVLYTVDDFADWVKGYVTFGHVHNPMESGNIVYNGSFIRFAHGEEHDKRCVLYTRDEKGEWSYRSLVNENTVVFHTVYVSDDEAEIINTNGNQYATEAYLETVSKHFHGKPGYIRVMCNDVSVRNFYQNLTVLNFPELIFTGVPLTTKKHITLDETTSVIQVAEELPVPTIENLSHMIMEFHKHLDIGYREVFSRIIDVLQKDK